VDDEDAWKENERQPKGNERCAGENRRERDQKLDGEAESANAKRCTSVEAIREPRQAGWRWFCHSEI
jgi:hypothetical protein